jgi:hypothetical protein
VCSCPVSPASGPGSSTLARSLAINAAAARLSNSDFPDPTARTAETSSIPLMSLIT